VALADTAAVNSSLLLPVEMMVDGNRDGEMSFTDMAVRDRDQTSAAKPYRFWLNNDHDIYHTVDGSDQEYDDVNDGIKDSSYTFILTKRDLEDFTRLRISFKGVVDLIKSTEYSCFLEWRSMDGAQTLPPADGAPEINVYQERQPDLRPLYLEDETVASNQLRSSGGISYDTWIGGTKPGQAMDLFAMRPSLRTAVSETNPTVNLLFCGKTAGRGQLVLSIKKGAQSIVQYPPVYLELKDVKDMYERYTVGDVQEANASVLSSLDYQHWPANAASLMPTPSGRPLAPPPDETKDYMLWVHGWNMSPFDKDSFGDTAFKRLFWQGYKGRFGTFRWPTFHFTSVPSIHHFDASEHRAWVSSLGLLNLCNQLNRGQFAGKVRMMAHSMGNVVAGEALRRAQSGQVVHSYVASQAAIPAHCYDAAAPLMGYASGLGPTTPNVYGYYWQMGAFSQPHHWQGEGRPSYMHSDYMSGKAGRYFNYYNDTDWALNWPRWQLDQQTKPDADYGYEYAGFGTSCGFLRDRGSGATWLTFPTDRHEIFAWASEPYSYALGAQWVAGVVGRNIDLKSAPFSYSDAHKYHSGQFLGTNMERRHYWERLLIDCVLKEEQ
jgi:hypothetical protein